MFNTLVIAVLLVAVVVLFFLQDWKAMILPMIDVPVSLVGTFAVMAALGFSLNNLTLFGLVLAIGIVVDDAIIVLENIERLMAHRAGRAAATIKAMDELTGPIVSITLVLSSRVPAERLYSGPDRPVLSTVRADDRRRDDHLGHQRADPDAVACRLHLQDRGGGRSRGKLGQASQKEALPWWFFGVRRRLLTVWLGPHFLAGHPGLAADAAEGASSPQMVVLAVTRLISSRPAGRSRGSAGSSSAR